MLSLVGDKGRAIKRANTGSGSGVKKVGGAAFALKEDSDEIYNVWGDEARESLA